MAGNQLSQAPLEIVVDVGPPAIRVTQDVVEILSLPVPDIRVTQDTIELLTSNFTSNEIRVTQDVIELLSSNPVIVTSSEQIQFIVIVP